MEFILSYSWKKKKSSERSPGNAAITRVAGWRSGERERERDGLGRERVTGETVAVFLLVFHITEATVLKFPQSTCAICSRRA